MRQGGLAAQQSPFGLLLLESAMRNLPISFLFLNLPHPLAQRTR